MREQLVPSFFGNKEAGVQPNSRKKPLKRDVVAIGSSAGGVETLLELVTKLPENLPAALIIVQHAAELSPGYLAGILNKAGPLPTTPARNGQVVHPGSISVAPPDLHLFVKSNRLRVCHGPRENNWRPSVDTLFRSVAVEYRSRAIGVILS